jgi:hypothetical protein
MIVRTGGPLLSLVPQLHGILNVEYSDGGAGPETLALTLAITAKCGGNVEQAISTATLFARGADGLPAITGALAGALASDIPWSASWEEAAVLRGVCVPDLEGVNYMKLVDDFVIACESRTGVSNLREGGAA